MTQYRYISPMGRTLGQVIRDNPGWKYLETISGGVLMFVRRGG